MKRIGTWGQESKKKGICRVEGLCGNGESDKIKIYGGKGGSIKKGDKIRNKRGNSPDPGKHNLDEGVAGG